MQYIELLGRLFRVNLRSPLKPRSGSEASGSTISSPTRMSRSTPRRTQ
jgi:hypothetical protein